MGAKPSASGLLVRLVFGVRRKVVRRPLVRAGLRVLGWPLIALMHRTAGRAPPPPPTPDERQEPVLRLPLDYAPAAPSPAPRIAVILHAFYVDVLPEVLARLRNIPFPADLYVSTDTAAKREATLAAFAGWTQGTVEVRLAPNRGRNIAPQLITFADVYPAYDLALLLHGKKSVHDEALDGWRDALFTDLLGSPEVVRGVVETFARAPRLGLLAPRTYHGIRPHMIWAENGDACRRLAARMGFALYPDSPVDFPAGAMFWARPAALKPLLDLGVAFEDFEVEQGQKDGTLAHAIERLAFHSAELSGFHWARAGSGEGVQRPEALVRVDRPRLLERFLTEGRRTVLLPGRRPQPIWPEPDHDLTPGERKAAFGDLARRDLAAFLASGDRLALPTSDQPVVSVIVVLFNRAELSFQCLRSLQSGLDRPGEVIVVDNASSDQTSDLLARLDGATVIRNAENLHFLRAVNQAAEVARGRVILLLNNDARLGHGAVGAALLTLDETPGAGAVGARIDLLDGTLQEAGSIIWNDGACLGYGRGGDPMAAEFQFRREVDYASGAFLMVRRDVFEQLGRLDPAFAPAYYEETDLAMRLRAAGWATIYEPQAVISHVEFASSGTESAFALQRAHQALFVARHDATLKAAHLPPGAPLLAARMRGAFVGRLLILDDQAPFPDRGAGYPRAAEILRAATGAGWFVTHYPMVETDVDFAAARLALPAGVEFAAGRGQDGLAAFLRERAGYYDAVLVSRPHNMAAFRRALRKARGAVRLDQVIYDAEAIFALRRPGADAADPEVRAELALAKDVGAVLTVSEAEAARFRVSHAAGVRVVGHALKPAPTAAPFSDRRDLLFVGALDEPGSPNVDSLAFFVAQVMPRLDALIGADYVLRVAGRAGAVGGLASERVRVLGRVEDLGPLYATSRLFVAPTRFAAGIPMKAHEAAAAGLPVAATPLLAGQLGWADGEALSVGEGAEGFARACAALYQDETLWTRVRAGALARVTADCEPQRFTAEVAAALAAAKG